MLLGQLFYLRYLGTDAVTETDEFSEKFETAVDPSFSVNLVAKVFDGTAGRLQYHRRRVVWQLTLRLGVYTNQG